jgi:hypothetical protein
MNMARRQAGTVTGPATPPWTVGAVRADLGRIVVTFNGTDRLSLPLTFSSQAENVALDELASLHLSAELQVPKQSYTFPASTSPWSTWRASCASTILAGRLRTTSSTC